MYQIKTTISITFNHKKYINSDLSYLKSLKNYLTLHHTKIHRVISTLAMLIGFESRLQLIFELNTHFTPLNYFTIFIKR